MLWHAVLELTKHRRNYYEMFVNLCHIEKYKVKDPLHILWGMHFQLKVPNTTSGNL